jgi:hypothetical protein
MTKKPAIAKNAPSYAHYTGAEGAATCGECRHRRAARKGQVMRLWCQKAMDLVGMPGEGKTILAATRGCKYWEPKGEQS